MNILIRSDSSSTIGTGHIARDLVLVEQYKEHNITFATRALKGNINQKIIEAGYNIEILKNNSFDELNRVIKKNSIDMIVIDHYGIDHNFEKKLKENNNNLKIFAFDDTYNKHYCDILLNPNIYGDLNRYKNLVINSCEIRCGAKFTLLRKEFIDEKNVQVTKNNKIKTIFIALGGSDSKNLYRKVLNILEQLNRIEKIKVIIATTLANKHLHTLIESTNKRDWIELMINSNNIATLMNRSDFLIITASGIANEAHYLNLPFIAIKTAKNQIEMFKYLKYNGYKTINKFNKKQLLRHIINFMESL